MQKIHVFHSDDELSHLKSTYQSLLVLLFYLIASKMQYARLCLYDLIIQKFCINLYKNNVDKYIVR